MCKLKTVKHEPRVCFFPRALMLISRLHKWPKCLDYLINLFVVACLFKKKKKGFKCKPKYPNLQCMSFPFPVFCFGIMAFSIVISPGEKGKKT